MSDDKKTCLEYVEPFSWSQTTVLRIFSEQWHKFILDEAWLSTLPHEISTLFTKKPTLFQKLINKKTLSISSTGASLNLGDLDYTIEFSFDNLEKKVEAQQRIIDDLMRRVAALEIMVHDQKEGVPSNDYDRKLPIDISDVMLRSYAAELGSSYNDSTVFNKLELFFTYQARIKKLLVTDIDVSNYTQPKWWRAVPTNTTGRICIYLNSKRKVRVQFVKFASDVGTMTYTLE